ncbi:hypothetical protein [Cellulomonas sp. NS3]|nr:hypothetical protein [Cellulomonas sp. NS3]
MGRFVSFESLSGRRRRRRGWLDQYGYDAYAQVMTRALAGGADNP